LFQRLEELGREPQLCDTLMPFFENAVMCGWQNSPRDGELRNFSRYLIEEIPKVLSFMHDYVEKTEGLK